MIHSLPYVVRNDLHTFLSIRLLEEVILHYLDLFQNGSTCMVVCLSFVGQYCHRENVNFMTFYTVLDIYLKSLQDEGPYGLRFERHYRVPHPVTIVNSDAHGVMHLLHAFQGTVTKLLSVLHLLGKPMDI